MSYGHATSSPQYVPPIGRRRSRQTPCMCRVGLCQPDNQGLHVLPAHSLYLFLREWAQCRSMQLLVCGIRKKNGVITQLPLPTHPSDLLNSSTRQPALCNSNSCPAPCLLHGQPNSVYGVVAADTKKWLLERLAQQSASLRSLSCPAGSVCHPDAEDDRPHQVQG